MRVIRSQIVVLPISFRNRKKKFAHHHRAVRIVNAVMLAHMPYAVAYQVSLVHRLNVVQNVWFPANVHQRKHVSIRNALIHVSEFAE